jgi:hypothetical protein
VKITFLCECGDVGCEKCVPLTRREYEALPPSGELALAEGHALESRAGG